MADLVLSVADPAVISVADPAVISAADPAADSVVVQAVVQAVQVADSVADSAVAPVVLVVDSMVAPVVLVDSAAVLVADLVDSVADPVADSAVVQVVQVAVGATVPSRRRWPLCKPQRPIRRLRPTRSRRSSPTFASPGKRRGPSWKLPRRNF